MKNLGGKQGVLWKMCKWRMAWITHSSLNGSPGR